MTYNQMMKEKELNENFEFTGLWERAFDVEAVNKMKARAKAEYKGYKTKVVRKDDGVSIYVRIDTTKTNVKMTLKKRLKIMKLAKKKQDLHLKLNLKDLVMNKMNTSNNLLSLQINKMMTHSKI